MVLVAVDDAVRALVGDGRDIAAFTARVPNNNAPLVVLAAFLIGPRVEGDGGLLVVLGRDPLRAVAAYVPQLGHLLPHVNKLNIEPLLAILVLLRDPDRHHVPEPRRLVAVRRDRAAEGHGVAAEVEVHVRQALPDVQLAVLAELVDADLVDAGGHVREGHGLRAVAKGRVHLQFDDAGARVLAVEALDLLVVEDPRGVVEVPLPRVEVQVQGRGLPGQHGPELELIAGPVVGDVAKPVRGLGHELRLVALVDAQPQQFAHALLDLLHASRFDVRREVVEGRAAGVVVALLHALV
mmetsp:Transcript_7254/g.21325  ORF Transcript_7254/g.21325 Transcript_7254/m.21325 type:complete len:295 (+) Transcript_7254:368-1252(+)